ncbi:MAG: CHRD domain-containing protein [Nitrospiraceae bacterium]
MTLTRLLSVGLVLPVALLVLLGFLVSGAANAGDDDGVKIQARLQGIQEVPAVSTGASGRFRGEISEDGSSIMYTLSYSGLEGAVRQGHIHFAQRGVNGGIVVWLCQTLVNTDPTGLAPTCPQSGTVTGTLTAANMVNTASAQGIVAPQFSELVRAIRAGVTYANVHSAGAGGTAGNFTGGEIRGQIKAHGDDD